MSEFRGYTGRHYRLQCKNGHRQESGKRQVTVMTSHMNLETNGFKNFYLTPRLEVLYFIPSDKFSSILQVQKP